jgi:Helix-turn-helix of DDE superfamily endonuclease/Transposase DDE domain
VAVYRRTNLTMRQIGPLFGVSHSAAHRVIDTLGPLLPLAPVRRRPKGQVAVVDGTLIPTRDHRLAAQSKNYRHSANLQVAIDAHSRLVIALGDPQPGNRNDTIVYRTSGINQQPAGRAVMADGAYRGNHEVIISVPQAPRRQPAAGLETGLQRRAPQNPRPRRTRPGPTQDLQDPARLPPRRPHPRGHRGRDRPPAQHRSGRLIRQPLPGNACTQLRDIT